MVAVRITIWTLGLVFVAAGIVSGQHGTEPLTPVSAALRLRAGLEKGSYDYERATQAISLSYWKHGDHESALAQIDTLEFREQSELLLHFADRAITSRQQAAARSALNRALDLVMSQEDPDSYLIPDFARLAIEVDDLELAVKFTDALDEGSARKAFALLSIAEGYARQGDKGKAIALLERAIKQSDSFDDNERGQVVVLLARSLKVFVALGEKERATTLANQVHELVLTSKAPDDVEVSLAAVSFVNLGNLPQALSLLDSFEGIDKTKSLVLRASLYQQSGNELSAVAALCQARAVLASDSDADKSRSHHLDRIARGYLRLGRIDEAFEVARGIRDNSWLQKHLAIALADAFAAKGRRSDAIAALDVASAQIQKIVSEKSEDIPGTASSSDARLKSGSLTELGEKYLEIGDVRGAEAAAMAIDQPQFKASLVADVAVAQFKEGNQSRGKSLLALALRLSTKSKPYNHDSSRDSTLLRIAKAYADVGFKADAAKVIQRFLAELRLNDDEGGTIEGLIEIGLMAESKDVPLNGNIQRALRTLVVKDADK